MGSSAVHTGPRAGARVQPTERFQLNTSRVRRTRLRVHATQVIPVLCTPSPLSERSLLTSWKTGDRHGHPLSRRVSTLIFGERRARSAGVVAERVIEEMFTKRFHTRCPAGGRSIRFLLVMMQHGISHRVIARRHTTRGLVVIAPVRGARHRLDHIRTIHQIQNGKKGSTEHKHANVASNQIQNRRHINNEPRARVYSIFWGLTRGWPKVRDLVRADELLWVVEPNVHVTLQ